MSYIYAVIASVFYALYVVPRKFSKSSPEVYTYFVGLGFFIFAIAKYLVGGMGGFADMRLVASVGMGVCWALGTVFFMVGIDRIGLARSRQWSRFSYPIGVIFAFIILHEHRDMNMFWFGAAFLAIMLAAVLLTLRTGESVNKLKSGVGFSMLSAVFFGIMPAIQKVAAGADANAQQVVMAASTLVAILFVMLIGRHAFRPILQVWKKDNLWALVGGVGYTLASLFAILAYRNIPASIGSTIIQLVSVWAILIGVIIFKEINWRKYSLRILLGILMAVVAILLTLMV